jgi:hypothetical protein
MNTNETTQAIEGTIIGLTDEQFEDNALAIINDNMPKLRHAIVTVKLLQSLGVLFKQMDSTNKSNTFASIQPAIVNAPKGSELESQKCILSATPNNGVYYAQTIQPTDPIVYKLTIYDYAKVHVNNVNIGNIESVVYNNFVIYVLVDMEHKSAKLVQINRADMVYDSVTSGKASQAIRHLGYDAILDFAALLQSKFVNMANNGNPMPSKDSVFNYRDKHGRYANTIYREYVDNRSNNL